MTDVRFTDHSFFDETLDTPSGPIRIFAETYIFGKHLVLDSFLFFPGRQIEAMPIGVAEALLVQCTPRRWAHEAGFDI